MDFKVLRRRLREKLKKKMRHLTKDEVDASHKLYIDYYSATKPDNVFIIPMEEMAELSQHLSKIVRGKEQATDLAFLEELVDVQICLDNLRIACDIDDEVFNYVMDIKFERSNSKIKSAIEKISIEDRWSHLVGGSFKVCDRLKSVYGLCVVYLGDDGGRIRVMTSKGERIIPAYDFISFRHIGWVKNATKEYVKELESHMCDVM